MVTVNIEAKMGAFVVPLRLADWCNTLNSWLFVGLWHRSSPKATARVSFGKAFGNLEGNGRWFVSLLSQLLSQKSYYRALILT